MIPNKKPAVVSERLAMNMNELRRTWRTLGWVSLLVAGTAGAWAAEPLAPTFTQDFSQVAVGKIPESFLVLDGQFEVKEADGNRFLELPGAPLDSYGVMFGSGAREDWGAQARFLGTGQGRRYPVFGVSLNGVAGYRVQVSPAKRAIELLKGDEVKVTFAFVWETGTWTQVRIQVRKVSEGSWKVEGKAWKDGTPEPANWMVVWNESETPIAGRAAIWGKPFSGTPIGFDDLKILPLEK
jgi:hypothetical protein